MTQKIVTFEVAKALKEAGYPQGYSVYGGTTCHYINENTIQHHSAIGLYENVLCAPTYISAWLWLWREKGICVDVWFDKGVTNMSTWDKYSKPILVDGKEYSDPEEAIAKAIEYLVENNLIK